MDIIDRHGCIPRHSERCGRRLRTAAICLQNVTWSKNGRFAGRLQWNLSQLLAGKMKHLTDLDTLALELVTAA
jgi:hypothetical protein